MISTPDIYWAAGFLEGEGCFTACHSSPRLTANQVQREPLERLQELFGGKIIVHQSKNINSQPIHLWYLPAQKSAEAMMTLYVLMSPRRQKRIAMLLTNWRKTNRHKKNGVCLRGHIIYGPNALKTTRGYICRICANEQQKKYYDTKKKYMRKLAKKSKPDTMEALFPYK